MEKDIKKLLLDLNIDIPGYYKDNGNYYTVDLKDSDEYDRIYSILDKSKDFSLSVTEAPVITEELSEFNFIDVNDYYMINLKANYFKDTYELNVFLIDELETEGDTEND